VQRPRESAKMAYCRAMMRIAAWHMRAARRALCQFTVRPLPCVCASPKMPVYAVRDAARGVDALCSATLPTVTSCLYAVPSDIFAHAATLSAAIADAACAR